MEQIAKLKRYRDTWVVTAFFSLISGVPALFTYLKEGHFHNPRGVTEVAGNDAIIMLTGLLGLGVISLVGFSYCTYRLNKTTPNEIPTGHEQNN